MCGLGHGDPVEPAAKECPKRRRRSSPPSFRSYFTLAAALRRRHGEGTAVTSWAYHNDEGCEVFRTLRIDYRDASGTRAKTYRPCYRGVDGRWRLSGRGGLLPLYNLLGVLASSPEMTVAVLEGEKCADIARALGLLTATASAHGAKSPRLTDWSPLAGRRVALLPDEDDRGAEYATEVTAILAGLSPPVSVTTIRLPGLANGEDIEQWMAVRRRGDRSDEEILDDLLAIIDAGFP